jgi:hypothetical protein
MGFSCITNIQERDGGNQSILVCLKYDKVKHYQISAFHILNVAKKSEEYIFVH